MSRNQPAGKTGSITSKDQPAGEAGGIISGDQPAGKSSGIISGKKPRRTAKQWMALLGIAVLAAMYLFNLMLALIGSEFTTNLLKGTLIMTFAVPILLYGMLVLMEGAGRFRKKPEDELTEEEREGYYQMVAERDEAKYQERVKAKEAREAAKKAGKNNRRKK